MPESTWVAYGLLGRPHGLRGEVLLHLHNDASPHLTALDVVRISQGGRTIDARVRALRKTAKGPLLVLDGLTDRDAIGAWTGAELLVPASTFTSLADEDEYYAYQLEGASLVGPDGERVGEVIEVVNFGAGDLLSARLSDGRTEYIPFSSPWVGEVNVAQGVIAVDLTDLFE